MKVYCHFCGATLREPAQFLELARPEYDDVIHICRDEARCLVRAAFDGPTDHPHDFRKTRTTG
jgi:hypothetical protein